MTIGAAASAAGGTMPGELPARAPGVHLPEFTSWSVWVRADLAVLERVRAALAGESEAGK